MSEVSWNFLTNYGHTLVCIARDPSLRIRDLAAKIGITERAVQRIIADLVEAGYLEKHRSGRRNSYKVLPGRKLRHTIEADCQIESLLTIVGAPLPEQPPLVKSGKS